MEMRRPQKRCRQIVVDTAAVSLVLAMVIARVLSASGRTRAHVPGVTNREPAEDEAGEERSPWRELRERLLKLGSREPGVRATVVAVVLAIAAAAGIIGFGGFFRQAHFLAPTPQGAQPVTASTGVFIASVVCTVLAWTLVVCGLLLGRWQARLAGLALLAAGAFAEWHALGADLSLFGGVLGLASITGILVLGLLTVAADFRASRGKRSFDFRSRSLAPVTGVIVGAFVLLAYLGQAARMGGVSSANEHAVWVLELVNITAVLIVPMLLIAGADLADFGGEVAKGIGWSIRRSRRAVALAGVVSAGILAAILLVRGGRLLLPALVAVPVIGLVTVLAARARPFPRWEKPLPALVLAGLLFWLLSAGQVAVGVVRTPPPVESVPLKLVVGDPGPPLFNFRVPEACGSGARRFLTAAGFAGAYVRNCHGLPYFYFEIWTSPGRQRNPCALPRMVEHIEGYARVRYSPAPRDGKWQACTVNDIGDHQQGTAWTWSTEGRTWMATALTDDQAGAYELQAPLLRQMRDSLRQSPTAAPLPRPPHPIGSARETAMILRNANAAWLAVAVVAAIILTLRKRRQSGPVDTALLYLTGTGAWIGLTGFGATAANLNVGELFDIEARGLAVLAAIGTLGYLAVRAVRAQNHNLPGGQVCTRGPFPDRLDRLLVLDLSLLAIWAAANLYAAATRGGKSFPVLLGLILLLALLWDLISSGQMLNPGKPTSPMPHRARVITYVGFLMLTTAAVLQLATLHSASTGAAVDAFESEQAVAAGIVEFGIPFAITFFLVSWFSRPEHDTSHDSPRSADGR
jgi:hypothetical protein